MSDQRFPLAVVVTLQELTREQRELYRFLVFRADEHGRGSASPTEISRDGFGDTAGLFPPGLIAGSIYRLLDVGLLELSNTGGRPIYQLTRWSEIVPEE